MPILSHRLRPGALVCAGLLAALAACGGDGSVGLAPSGPQAPGNGGIAGAPSTGALGTNFLDGSKLWVDAASNARRTADAWRASRPADATQLDKIASQPQVRWFGNWNTDIAHDVDAAVTTMAGDGAIPVFVAYNIPNRDCGGLSGATATTVSGYRAWIAGFAAGLAGRRAAVILEPDAVAGLDCLSAPDQAQRLALLHDAVTTLRGTGSVAVYLDAGNPAWHPASVMADRLAQAGLENAQGFALNVSNFLATSENIAYGTQLSALTGGKHFLIDTSRNGAGGNGDWCNPAGQALGERPTTSTGKPLVDAFLWVKAPGESDGACNGGPAAGAWMPEYALGLAQRAAY